MVHKFMIIYLVFNWAGISVLHHNFNVLPRVSDTSLIAVLDQKPLWPGKEN